MKFVFSSLCTLLSCRLSFQRFVVQLLSRVQLFATPWTAAHQAFLSFTDFLLLAYIYYTSSTLSKACIIVSVDTARDKVACCITFVVKFSWMNLNSPQECTSLKIGVIFTQSQDAYSNSYCSDLLILKSYYPKLFAKEQLATDRHYFPFNKNFYPTTPFLSSLSITVYIKYYGLYKRVVRLT